MAGAASEVLNGVGDEQVRRGEKATFCILRQPEMLHLETRIYFTLSSVVLYEFPQYEFPQAVRLYEFPQPVPVLDLASMVHVLQYR